MPNWFGKKDPPEKSPGGSVIHRYQPEEFRGARFGFTDESTAGFTEAREEVYGRLFGTAESVSHEVIPQIPHVDVYTYYRTQANGGKVCVLVTGGMSDLKMNVPPGLDAPGRVELIFYCSEPRPEFIDTMRWLAHFPHNQRTWVGAGHTIPNGNPPAPFWGSAILDTILLMPTIVTKDAALPDELKLAGEPVHFLWIVPLTTAECNLKLEKGFDAILDLFQEHRHPHVYDPGRQSYA